MFSVGFVGNYPQESAVQSGVVYGDFDELTGTLSGSAQASPETPQGLEILTVPPVENLVYG